MPDGSPFLLSLRVAAIAAVLAIGPAVWLARWLEHRPSRTAAVVLSLTLVLPPAVFVGFFLFYFSGRSFSWPWAVAAAMVNAIPALLLSALAAFGSLDRRYEDAARSLGASEWRVFWRVALPLAWRPLGLVWAIVFGRILVEYGAVLLIAGRLRT